MNPQRLPSAESPSPGVYLIAAKFAFQHGGSESIAIPVQIPVSPEFPVMTASAIAYPLGPLQKNPKVVVRCLLRKVLAEEEKDEDAWATIQVEFIPDTSIPHSTTTDVLLPPTQFIFQSGEQFSSQDDKAGYMDMVMNLQPVLDQLNKVGRTSFSMKWQWRDGMAEEKGAFRDIGTYPFSFFWTLDKLNAPWGWPGSGGIVPSVALLRHACEWASGAEDATGALSKIVTSIWTKTHFQYSYSQAYTTFGVDKNGLPCVEDGKSKITVDATALSEHLKGLFGDGVNVNCADLAHIVMLMGNILGCKVNVGILANLENPVAGFDLNPHWQLGDADLVENHSFIYHQVAYVGEAFNEEAIVFDPCLAFGTDNPSDLILGWKLSDYIKKLATDEKKCCPLVDLKSWEIQII